jgi:hypothetical protein
MRSDTPARGALAAGHPKTQPTEKRSMSKYTVRTYHNAAAMFAVVGVDEVEAE